MRDSTCDLLLDRALGCSANLGHPLEELDFPDGERLVQGSRRQSAGSRFARQRGRSLGDLGLFHGSLGFRLGRLKTGTPPRCDLPAERTLGTTVLGLIQSGLVKSAHDCAEGGLAVAIAESCISNYEGRNTSTLIGAKVT